MAQLLYLTPGTDTAAFGVSASATLDQIGLATALVNAYLRRPKGLVYTPDAHGFPAMMAGAAPEMTYTIKGGIAPGSMVVATLAPANITPDFVGEVLVIDASTAAGQNNVMEACQVVSVTGNNQVTLLNVQFTHTDGALAQTGLTLVEEKSLPNKRSVLQLSELPSVGLLSLQGRYAYGRRSDQVGGLYQEMNLLASVQTFGGPPQWITVSPQQASLSPRSGELWVPAGMLLAYYSDVRVRYIAGWTQSTLPDAIKAATAALVNAMVQNAGVSISLAEAKTGSGGFKRFTASLFDSDIQRMLDPYRARLNY